MQTGPFWMVWNVNGTAATRPHTSLDAANNEAARLARLAPGQTFVVLEALHGFRMASSPIERVGLSDVDHTPF